MGRLITPRDRELIDPRRRRLITGAAALTMFAALPVGLGHNGGPEWEEAEAGINHGLAGVVPDTTAVFDAATCPAYIQLSNGNRTATYIGPTDNVWGTVRTTVNFSTGLKCLEFAVTTLSNSCWVGVAVGDGATNTFLGNDGHAVGFSNGGDVAAPSLARNSFSPPFYAAGQTVMVARNATLGFDYARSSAQATWIGNPGSADPVAGTGGVNESSAFFGPPTAAYFAISIKNLGDVITINQVFTQAKPTGYTGAP